MEKADSEKTPNCVESQRSLEKLSMLNKGFDDYLQNLSDENKLTLIKSYKQGKDKSIEDIRYSGANVNTVLSLFFFFLVKALTRNSRFHMQAKPKWKVVPLSNLLLSEYFRGALEQKQNKT